MTAAVVCGALLVGTAAASGGPAGIDSPRGLPEYGAPMHLGDMPSNTSGSGWHTNFFVAADFNGDGLPDILATRSLWQSGLLFSPTVFVNTGHGQFQDETTSLFAGHVPTPMDPRRVLVADFNRDGRPDVFIADQGTDLPGSPGHQNTLILSAPGGKLVDATPNLPQQDDYTHAAAVADVNGDGAPDIFVGQIGGTVENEIQLNDGSGHFSVEPHGIADDLANPQACRVVLSAAFADVDGNGSQDLVLGGGFNPCYPMPTGVLLNDGHGRFPALTQQFPQPPFGFDSPSDIQVGDLNGDGAPDIVIAYTKHDWVGRWLQIMINDGHGHFTDETTGRLPPQRDNNLGWIKWVKLVDLNGDRRLDIATSVQPLGPPWRASSPYFLNDGTGVFSRLPDNLALGQSDTYALAELGGGRGLDVVTGGDPDVSLVRTIRPSGRRLYGTAGPGTHVSLVLDSGRPARRVRPGYHQVVVWDRSPSDGFRLRGRGVNSFTSRTYTGVTYWDVYLKRRSRYIFSLTSNPSSYGSFKTGKP